MREKRPKKNKAISRFLEGVRMIRMVKNKKVKPKEVKMEKPNKQRLLPQSKRSMIRIQ